MFGLKEFSRILTPDYYSVHENGMVALDSKKIEKDLGIKPENVTKLQVYDTDDGKIVYIQYYVPQIFSEVEKYAIADAWLTYLKALE